MPVMTQPDSLGDLLKYEAPNLYSRDRDTVAAGQTLTLGTVVGREKATRKLKALDPEATDGSEIAVGVLGSDADATLMDKDVLLIARHAIVASLALVWPETLSPDQHTTALAQLEARGVLVRPSA